MTLPIHPSINCLSSYTSTGTIEEACSNKNWSLLREIINADPELLYKQDSDSKTIFHRIIDAQDLEAFDVVSEFIDRSKMKPKEGVLERLSINDYIVVHGNIQMLEKFVKHQKYHEDRLFACAVKYGKRDHLEWLSKNVPFETEDYNALHQACVKTDPETAFFIMDLFPKGYFSDDDSHPHIIIDVIAQKSLPFIKSMVERLLLESKNKDYSYFSKYDSFIYKIALKTWDKDIIEYFISLTGAEIFKARDKDQYFIVKFIDENKLNFLEFFFNKYSGLKEELKDVLEFLLFKCAVNDFDEEAKILIDWGVDVNAIVYQNESASFPIIAGAIKFNCEKVISLLLKHRVRVWDKDGPLLDCLYYAIQANLIELAEYIIDHEEERKYNYASEIAIAFEKDSSLINRLLEKRYINVHNFSQKLANVLIKSIDVSSKISKYVMYTVFETHFKIKNLTKRENFLKNISYLVDSSLHPSDLNYLVFHIFGGGSVFSHKSLYKLPDLAKKLVEDMNFLNQESIKTYLLGLQAYNHEVFKDFSMVLRATLQSSLTIPDKSVFLTLSEDECLRWLEYGALFRSRKSLSLIYFLLKHKEIPDSQLIMLLKAISAIGMPHLNHSGKQWLIGKLISVLKEHKFHKIKVEAAKALWLVDKNQNNQQIKNALLEQLNFSYPSKLNLALIDILSNYEDGPNFKFAEKLIEFYQTNPSDQELVAIALALRKIPHKEGLLIALKIVQSPVWSTKDRSYAMHHKVLRGMPFLLIYVPKGWHLNRLAIVENIQDQLVKIYDSTETFQMRLSEARSLYKTSSQSYPQVREFSLQYKKQERRALGAPIFFPKDAHLARVLGTRKGPELYKKSICALFTQGCFKSDLTNQDVQPNAGSWHKLGHIFSTSDLELFYNHAINGYLTEESLMIIFSADKFNQAQRVGQARMEEEGTMNPVFYEGISKAEIECVYMHEKLRHDIESIASEEPLSEVKAKLNSGIFDEFSLKELKQMRRHLLIKEEHNGRFRSLIEKITYYTDEQPLTRERIERRFKFATREEIYAKSQEMLLAREILAEHLQLSPATFLCQDQLLKLDDAQFREFLPHLFNMLPKELLMLSDFDLSQSRQKLLRLDTTQFSEFPDLRAALRLALLYVKLFNAENFLEASSRMQELNQSILIKLKFLGITCPEIIFMFLHTYSMALVKEVYSASELEGFVQKNIAGYYARIDFPTFKHEHAQEAVATFINLMKDD